jgi:aminoglycoside 3-N-acetyltransferase
MTTPEILVTDLHSLGVQKGDTLMVHASFKSLGIRHPEEIILALLDALGPSGTLLMPALSYLQEPPEVHDTRHTPSCVGYLAEYFRCRSGTRRSLHPTHSACGVGANASLYLEDHILDSTPCGEHSPFNKLLQMQGKILMLGCGLAPNTSMHAIEEYIQPSYLFAGLRDYTITDEHGNTFVKSYNRHSFRHAEQRYERITGLMQPPDLRRGRVSLAESYLISAPALFVCALEKMRQDPLYFVEVTG